MYIGKSKAGKRREMGSAWEHRVEPVDDIVQPVSLWFLELDADLIKYVLGREVQLGAVIWSLG